MTFTSGSAWVNIDGYWPFCVGPHRTKVVHGVARIGGGVEKGETAGEAAVREWMEEANTPIELVEPPACYTSGENLVVTEVEKPADVSPSPIFYREGAVFLARATQRPVPGAECRGILMLTSEDIGLLCTEEMTLCEAQGHGIELIESRIHPTLDGSTKLRVEWPRIFHQVFTRHPDLEAHTRGWRE